jgi:hypothetical protein
VLVNGKRVSGGRAEDVRLWWNGVSRGGITTDMRPNPGIIPHAVPTMSPDALQDPLRELNGAQRILSRNARGGSISNGLDEVAQLKCERLGALRGGFFGHLEHFAEEAFPHRAWLTEIDAAKFDPARFCARA